MAERPLTPPGPRGSDSIDHDEVMGKYELLDVLGEGATAKVYRAVHRGPMGFRKDVAFKLIHTHVAKDRKVIETLINEARLGGVLRHRNIVDVYEFDQIGDTYYMAMEYVRGYTLAHVLGRLRGDGGLPIHVVTDVVIQVCEGLAYANALADDTGRPMNLVHRDLKPSNVMLTVDGTVKIMDFGIAKATANLFKTTASGITKGTPAYMSPEQVAGQDLDGRSDIFSLGALMAEMVTGKRAFAEPQLRDVLKRIKRADVGAILDAVEERVPPLTPIVRRAMQLNPVDRYRTATDMARAIRGVQLELTVEQSLGDWVREWMEDPDPSETFEHLSTPVPVMVFPGLKMVPVPAGAFWMGSPESEMGRDASERLHRVRLTRPLMVAQTVVTQELFEEIMGFNPSRNIGSTHPVEMVSWLDAVEFCNDLSVLEGLQPCYVRHRDAVSWIRSANGYRLLTEAEWEYAARAGDDAPFAGATMPDEVAWYWGNARSCSQPVARLKPNDWDLYDMSGNVWEWVWDLFGPYDDDNEVVDPLGPTEGSLRLARGGSWYNMPEDLRVACRRCRAAPTDANPFTGFRIARNVT